MKFITRPSSDSDLFYKYFECVWYMELDDNWRHWYKQQELIREVMEHYQKDASEACFLMLSESHDIIYDREL